MTPEMTEKAQKKLLKAVTHVLRLIQQDGRIAYFIGDYTKSFDLLTDAYAEAEGQDVEGLREKLLARINPVEPSCPQCQHCKGKA